MNGMLVQTLYFTDDIVALAENEKEYNTIPTTINDIIYNEFKMNNH